MSTAMTLQEIKRWAYGLAADFVASDMETCPEVVEDTSTEGDLKKLALLQVVKELRKKAKAK
jgi:hypothetical protein